MYLRTVKTSTSIRVEMAFRFAGIDGMPMNIGLFFFL